MNETATAVEMIGRLRRAYFALCRELGVGEDERRALNESVARKPSSKRFSLTDWRNVVAHLQRLNGQDAQPGRPRIRSGSDRPPRGIEDMPEVETATAAQVETIEGLAARIFWSRGPAAFVRSRVLAGPRSACWDGAWPTLARDEASKVILALQKLARSP